MPGVSNTGVLQIAHRVTDYSAVERLDCFYLNVAGVTSYSSSRTQDATYADTNTISKNLVKTGPGQVLQWGRSATLILLRYMS